MILVVWSAVSASVSQALRLPILSLTLGFLKLVGDRVRLQSARSRTYIKCTDRAQGA